MKILLLGEYSNVHNTLAQGLRHLSHEVTVASNGDFWKDYPRDIDLARTPGKLGGIKLMAKVAAQLPRWRGYDIVQLINPMFLELKAERIFPVYRYLRRHNRAMVLCALGMDYYWVHECITRKPLRYSDFNFGDELRTDPIAIRDRDDWIDTPKGNLNKHIAQDCDAIVATPYENYACYKPVFPEKTRFIPLPIASGENGEVRAERLQQERNNPLTSHLSPLTTHLSPLTPLRLFIGISRGRSVYKGTDIMLHAAEDVQRQYPDRLQLLKAEGLPFDEYQRMMDGSDAMMDQLYSYAPAMNALLAMSKGIVVIGGGEPENYEILGETHLKPIVNVEPSYESVRHELEQLVLHPERLPILKRQSQEYIRRHHDYLTVARRYEALYRELL